MCATRISPLGVPRDSFLRTVQGCRECGTPDLFLFLGRLLFTVQTGLSAAAQVNRHTGHQNMPVTKSCAFSVSGFVSATYPSTHAPVEQNTGIKLRVL